MTEMFAGKVALVTGAGGGIGLFSAKAFAEAGASVIVADRNAETIGKAAEGCDRRATMPWAWSATLLTRLR